MNVLVGKREGDDVVAPLVVELNVAAGANHNVLLWQLGHAMTYKGPRQIMQEIAGALPAFAGATYEAMGLEGVRLQYVGEVV